MRTYRRDTFAGVYRDILTDTLKNPEYENAPRGQKIREITNVALEFDPLFPLYENTVRGSQFEYIAGELVWYFNGLSDIQFISNFSKFWGNLDNGDGTVNSAYGNLIFTEKNEHGHSQWNWALNSLLDDKDSRQAIMHFNKPKHQQESNKDFVCTLTGIFQIRDNHLNFTVNMRSNDLILGLPTDVAFFCLLQQQMLKFLKVKYPKLRLGTYTHIMNSAHIYERHFNLVERMIDAKRCDESKLSAFKPMKYPRLRNNLIKPDGSPTLDMIQLKNDVILGENDNSKVFDDSLYSWISELNTKTINKQQ